MTRNPIRRTGLVLLTLSLLLPITPLSAEDAKDLRELLRDGLYTEEVTRDPEAAAKQYEALLSQHDAQRAFAVSALFRLAEVRRKQDRKDEAIALYQKLLDRFPEAETEAKLARENLAALGAKPAETKEPAKARDYEQEEIERLRKLAAASPDLLPSELIQAIYAERIKVVEFLISQGVDRKTPDALPTAVAAKGNLAICKMLLKQGKPAPEVAGRTLSDAIGADRLEILNYLLEQGLDANSPVNGQIDTPVSPLQVAVMAGKLKAATLLLDHGADIDFMIQSHGDPGLFGYVGTALHMSTMVENGLPMFRLLLERGAKPDLPTPHAGVTPLHIAAWMGHADGLEMVKELLARGADPNRRSTLPSADSVPKLYAMVTPFELALRNNVTNAGERVDAMLAKGANPNLHDSEGHTLLSTAVRQKDSKRIELFLRFKADPNVADKDGATPLTIACGNGKLETVRRLLDAGADPNLPNGNKTTPLAIIANLDAGWPIMELLLAKGAKPEPATFKKAVDAGKWDLVMKLLEAGAPLPSPSTDFPWTTPLAVTMTSDKGLPVLEKMIAMGAKPDDAWIKSGFDSRHYDPAHPIYPARQVRSYLFRKFMLPALEESPGVRLVIPGSTYTSVTMVDEPGGDVAPRPLPLSLLDPSAPLNVDWRIIPADRITVWRKSPDGWTAVAERSFGDAGDFPALQRGDVVEVSDGPDPEQSRSKEKGRETVEDLFSPKLRWELRRRISFPVTLEIDGKVQELTMRGDRLIHDPTSPVVPWCSAGGLAGLRWLPGWALGPETGMAVVILRQNWPEVRLPFPSNEASRFMLKPGDQVKLETPPRAIEFMTAMRKDRVGFRVAGLPYGKMIECAGGNNLAGTGRASPSPLVPEMAPTLCQLLAEGQAVPPDWAGFSDLPPESIPIDFKSSTVPATVLPHPDWSRIRILRLKEDGSEEPIEVNLAALIEATNANAPADEIKKHDIQLMPGDIVELQVHEDRLNQPWKGLSAKEESFLDKAVQGRVQVIGKDSKIRLEEIRFKAPAAVETPGGWIPVPPKSGTQSVRASKLMGDRIRLEFSRNGKTYGDVNPSLVFLRDGDQMKEQGPTGSWRPRIAPPSPSR